MSPVDRCDRPLASYERHPDDPFAGAYAQGVQARDAVAPPALVERARPHYDARDACGIAATEGLLEALERVVENATARLESSPVDT